MEFQFGTDWAVFSNYAGGVIGQTLAMEGMFAFFLESAFLGMLLVGPERVGARLQWVAAVAVFVGAWLSGWFIIATNAWMQNPVAYETDAAWNVTLTSFWGLMANPWLPRAGRPPRRPASPGCVYGLLRTSDGSSPPEAVPAGTTVFTMLGFSGLYLFMSLLSPRTRAGMGRRAHAGRRRDVAAPRGAD